MNYAVISIDKATKRIVTARMYSEPKGSEIGVEELPSGNLTDYLYKDGEYIYSPYENITAEQLEQIKERKLSETSSLCENIIYNGIDVELSDGQYHFSLTNNDQTNIDGIFNAIILGASEYPYHADSQPCKMFSAEDITTLYISVKTFITKQTTYNNMLRQWIKRETDANTIDSIVYGCELPEDLNTQMIEILTSANNQIQSVISKLNS